MKKLKVLVIDDQESIRFIVEEIFKTMFNGRDFELLEASEGGEGISIMFQEKGMVDLIVTDYRMPGGENGFEVAKFAQENYPGIKVVLMTAEPLVSGVDLRDERANEFQKTAAMLGIKIIIPKPFTLGEFRDKIEEVIRNI